MIRVLHSVSNMDRAGIETMLMNYYRNIDKEKIQFYFLCNKNKPGAYDEEIKKMGGKIFHSPGLNPLKWFKYQKVVQKIIKDNKIDIMHVHNGALGLQALIAAKKSGIKNIIYHAHGTKIDKNFKLPLKLLYKKKLTKYANHYWGCGIEAIKFYCGKKVVDSKNYTIITNAIDEEKFKFDENTRNKIRKKLNITDEILIGHVGRFLAVKNHNFIIDIFYELVKENKKYKLILIGDGELENEIKEKVKKLAISDNVIFTGNIPNTYEYYQAMDLFFMPSLFEGLPVVGIEAQAAGLNCLLSDAITKEVDITGNVEFLSINEDKKIWIETIKKLSKKRNKIENEIVDRGYSIKEEAKKLENKYIDFIK